MLHVAPTLVSGAADELYSVIVCLEPGGWMLLATKVRNQSGGGGPVAKWKSN